MIYLHTPPSFAYHCLSSQRMTMLMLTLCLHLVSIAQFRIDSIHAHIDYDLPVTPIAKQTVHPQAGHGGITLARIESADHVNPFSTLGMLSANWSLCFDSLITPDAFTYGIYQPLIADDLRISADHRTLQFRIHAAARFADHSPITSADVIASIAYVIAHGQLSFQLLQSLDLVFQPIDDRHFTITAPKPLRFSDILAIGQLPITHKRHLGQAKQPLSSGAYRLSAFYRNNHAVFEKTTDYWAQDLPSRQGMYQFSSIKLRYFKSRTASFAAFTRKDADYRWEDLYENWQHLQQIAHKQPQLKLKTLLQTRPVGMNGLVFNQRRQQWQSRIMRQALHHAFDFPTLNERLFNRQYQRLKSFFTHTPFANQQFQPLAFDLKQADRLLTEAGWQHYQGARVHQQQTQSLQVHILVDSVGNEKIANIYASNLRRLGIKVRIERSDQADYLYRLHAGKFDLAIFSLPIAQQQPESIVQQFVFSAQNPYQLGSLFGIHDASVVEQLSQLSTAADRVKLLAHIDLAMMQSLAFIPFWHPTHDKFAYWQSIDGPDAPLQCRPRDNFQFWWPTGLQP